MIGDRGVDMRAARHHGLAAVGALWGFGSREELAEGGAHAFCESPPQLLAVLAHSARLLSHQHPFGPLRSLVMDEDDRTEVYYYLQNGRTPIAVADNLPVDMAVALLTKLITERGGKPKIPSKR